MSTTEQHSEQYRGYSVTRVPMGHWNVSVGDGFCGGFKALQAAKDWIDNRFWSVERVELPDGRIGYRAMKVAA